MLREQPTGGLHQDYVQTRSREAHERGHTFYHTTCPDGCAAARKWAARRLITPRAFLNAARVSKGLEDMADILGVLPDDACSYMGCLDPDEWLIMVRLTGITGTFQE